MVALVVVIVHKAGNLNFKFGREKIVLQVHNILHRAVVTLDLALSHGMVRGRVSVLDVPVFQEGP